MKRTLLSLFGIAAIALTLNAQYTFSESSGVYVPLTAAADTITDPQTLPVWDDEWLRIGLPFQVNMYGVWYDSAGVETNGELVLYNDWTGVDDPWYDVNDTVPAIMGFGEYFSLNATGDLKSRGPNQSPILTYLYGAPGSQIFIIEWRNAGFYEDTSAQLTNFVNFQIWIHEISGNIEFHYGTSLIDEPSYGSSDGPTIGIATTDLTANTWILFPGIYIAGTTTNETAGTAITTMWGQPADSTIYFFTNLATVGITQIERSTFTMYPNPAAVQCNLVLSDPNSVVMITDATGRLL
ncbi:MAG TPA: hypothetical protein VK826_20815, partial [Bacteroidia bacterium]|nr:hypothetical protein [Bacteroidia bacterium]